MSVYRKFVPTVPTPDLTENDSGNTILQVVDDKFVPTVPTVPTKKKLRDTEGKEKNIFPDDDSDEEKNIFFDDYSIGSTFFLSGNSGNKGQNTLENCVPIDWERAGTVGTKSGNITSKVRTFTTFAEAWEHWCAVEPTMPAGLWRKDCATAPGLWCDAESGLFLVRGAA